LISESADCDDNRGTLTTATSD